MPLLKKEIVADNTYTAKALQGKQLVDVKRKFDPKYQERLASTANSMIANGLRIPAPFGHHKDAIPKVQIDHGTPQSSFNNAGYWAFFSQDKNADGKPALFGFIDLPGSDEDTNSAYYKAKNSAKEVSISIRDKYKDGLDREWEDAIMHVALVNHPVVPGQSDFEDVPEGSFTLNMSMVEEEETNNLSIISSLKTALAERGIYLPSDCSYESILRDILVAASQKTSNGVTELTPVPIYMSTLGEEEMPMSIEAAKVLVATKAVNPETKQPFTMEDLGFKQAPQQLDMSTLQTQLAEKDTKITKLTSIVNAMMTATSNKIKSDIQSRLNALKTRGLPEATVAALQPQIEFQMSMLADGSGIAPHPLEVTLSALETSLPEVKIPAKDPLRGGYLPPNPFAETSISDKDLDQNIDELMQFIK